MTTTLLLLFALKVLTPGEMACVGDVQNRTIPIELYIAGMEQEGMLTLATQGQIVYLNGPKVASLKTGTVQRVIRPEGKVHDPSTGTELGIYYRDIGTIQIEAVQREKATARVLLSCHGLLKGDLVIPNSEKPAMEFGGDMSNALLQIPENGLVGSIVLGKDSIRELAAGQFCFIGLGGRDGVKTGDRFTVFRPYPKFNSIDLIAGGSGANLTYSAGRSLGYRGKIKGLLHDRTLPQEILGDIIVVEAGDSMSTGKVINSLSVIHVGDLVVKR